MTPSQPVDPEAIATRAAAVRSRVDAAGGHEVRIVAVTKTLPAAAIDAAVEAGLTDIGENYAQECVAKFDEVVTHPTLHFIGRLQRNKVRSLAPIVDLWQSVDRVELGLEIAKHSPGARVLAQVDISGEDTKGGCPPADVPALVEALIADGLVVEGLMGIAINAEPEAGRPGFRLLRSLVDELGLQECSMGMTADLEVAIEEGATMVRVGTDIFGPRVR